MARSRFSTIVLKLGVAVFLCTCAVAAFAQANDEKNQSFDVKSSVGDMHLGDDASPREAGLPLYPGARLRKNDKDGTSANLSLFTSAFGVKLVALRYDSDDATGKIVAYYRDKLKKYGKVLECHTSEHGGDMRIHDDDKSEKNKELKCEGDNSGSVIELKAGTEDNQHVVAVEPAESGKGSTFALVYMYARGKQGDI